MNVIFVRHADLKYPYNNYDKLSLQQLDSLAMEKIQPEINRTLAKKKINKHIADGFLSKNEVAAIYHSPSLRAKSTAALLADALNIKEIKELECLHEIRFSPKKLTSKAVFEDRGMNAVREAVYSAVEQNKTEEDTLEVAHRIQQIQQIITTDSDHTIIMVTHGFFMRLLQIAFLKSKLSFSVSDQKKAVNYDYLQGFIHIDE